MVFHSFNSYIETIWMLYDLLLIILLPVIKIQAESELI